MGTRHHQTVIDKEGNLKIAQYGQWDGYPSGQGASILEYLRNGNLDKYQKQLAKIPQITEEEINKVNESKDWKSEYPYLSRDCGSDIHKLIEDGKVKFVQHTSMEEAQKWCEGFYTIDFQKNEFVTEFNGISKSYSIDKLPTEKKYLKDCEPTDED